jgi:hypothetical protein
MHMSDDLSKSSWWSVLICSVWANSCSGHRICHWRSFGNVFMTWILARRTRFSVRLVTRSVSFQGIIISPKAEASTNITSNLVSTFQRRVTRCWPWPWLRIPKSFEFHLTSVTEWWAQQWNYDRYGMPRWWLFGMDALFANWIAGSIGKCRKREIRRREICLFFHEHGWTGTEGYALVGGNPEVRSHPSFQFGLFPWIMKLGTSGSSKIENPSQLKLCATSAFTRANHLHHWQRYDLRQKCLPKKLSLRSQFAPKRSTPISSVAMEWEVIHHVLSTR